MGGQQRPPGWFQLLGGGGLGAFSGRAGPHPPSHPDLIPGEDVADLKTKYSKTVTKPAVGSCFSKTREWKRKRNGVGQDIVCQLVK